MDDAWLRSGSAHDLGQLVGHMEQLAGVRLVEAADGPARGSRIVQVWTGSGLVFDVLAERALDIHACHFRGVPLAWVSPLSVVHPAYYEPEGAAWLRTYGGGLFVTGGLDHFGAPTEYPDGQVGLHGRSANLPTQSLGYRAYWEKQVYVLEVTGQVRQARLFGENLVMERRISTALGASRIRIEDVVTNQGSVAQRHLFVYHFNIGYPMVSETSRLCADVRETVPHDAAATAAVPGWSRFQEPMAGFREQNFWHVPVPDSEGRVQVVLESPLTGLALRWTYDATWLPYLLEWKMMGQGAYVVGIEPCNCTGMGSPLSPDDPADLPHLAPGESRRYSVDVEVLELGGGAEAAT
ncbi:MAG: aldose 1-epimerase family protein [Anaerolineales bacterium]|nr:aldose 1-epimerase family protein [Anaerolineales bacterium]